MSKAMEKHGNCSKVTQYNPFLLIIEHSTFFWPPPKNCGHIKYISTIYSSEIGFDWQNGRTFIKTWSLVEIFDTCKD